ncbi:MAG: class I SAM-dependent methyltransferase [Geminicoccaceae bacterium]
MASAIEATAPDIRHRMARMYRPQKHIYDLTRRYYLLGRDRLIAGLDLRPGQSVLDIGCGTGRNLALIGVRWPDARLYGLDAAEPMLEVARTRLRRGGVRATLAHGVAETLDPAATFGSLGFDHVTISYCLSMVDDPAAAIRAATAALRPGGTLHVVDFGDMTGLPAWFARFMRGWLARFHVRHRPEILPTLRRTAQQRGASLAQIEIAGRYALLHRLQLPPA